MSTLATAAAEEEVVVDLVVRLRSTTVVRGRRSALDRYDDGRVPLLGKDMTPQSIGFPSEAVGIVETSFDVFPVARVGWEIICVGRHARQRQDRSFVRHVGPRKLVDRPC